VKKPLKQIPVAMRECRVCGNLIPVRRGIMDEHTTRGHGTYAVVFDSETECPGSGRPYKERRK